MGLFNIFRVIHSLFGGASQLVQDVRHRKAYSDAENGKTWTFMTMNMKRLV